MVVRAVSGELAGGIGSVQASPPLAAHASESSFDGGWHSRLFDLGGAEVREICSEFYSPRARQMPNRQKRTGDPSPVVLSGELVYATWSASPRSIGQCRIGKDPDKPGQWVGRHARRAAAFATRSRVKAWTVQTSLRGSATALFVRRGVTALSAPAEVSPGEAASGAAVAPGLDAKLANGARQAGQQWALSQRNAFVDDDRMPSGGWPGTMTEARARVALALQLGRAGYGRDRLDPAQGEAVARLVYSSARDTWMSIREPENMGDELPGPRRPSRAATGIETTQQRVDTEGGAECDAPSYG